MSNGTNTFQIKQLSDDLTEPITIEDVKSFSSIDSSYAKPDADISIMITSARELLEGALNQYLIQRDVEIQYSQQLFTLPYGPTEVVTEVKKNGTDVLVLHTDYEVRGLEYKSIFLKNYAWGGEYQLFYPIYGGWPYLWNWIECPDNFSYYNVKYTTGYEIIPKLLKHALLMLVDYFLKEQGTTELEIPAAVMNLASLFSRNLVIQ